MDNTAFHKTAKIRELFENSSFTIQNLPPYSLDFNPIKKYLANIKKRRIYPNNNLDEVIKCTNLYCNDYTTHKNDDSMYAYLILSFGIIKKIKELQ